MASLRAVTRDYTEQRAVEDRFAAYANRATLADPAASEQLTRQGNPRR